MEYIIKNKTLVFIFIILLAISPSFALGAGNRNLLLIGVMLTSPIILLRYPIIIPKVDIPLICLGVMIIVYPLIFHPETMRWSTVLYSCLFSLFFMAFARILYNSSFSSHDFLFLLKWLIFSFCIVLIIQQFCVLTGLPIFNISNYNPMEPWKLNSLTAEPSHTARILTLLMFMYIITFKHINGFTHISDLLPKIDKLVLVAYLYPIFTMGSGTGFIFLLLLILSFVSPKKIGTIVILIFVLLPVAYIVIQNIESANRSFKFITLLLEFDETSLIRKDLSAAIRIIPTIHGAKSVSIFTIDGLFGHGIDADAGLTPLPSVTLGAGSLSIWYNFGFIVSILFWAFSLSICFIKGRATMSIIFWFLLCFFYGGFNNQIVWFTLCLFLTYKFIIRQNNERNLGR